MRTGLLIACMLTVGILARAQLFQARIVDAMTNMPIDGASVKTYPAVQSTYTDENGNFSVKEKFEKISISNIGYKTVEISKGSIIIANYRVALERQAVQLSSVSITRQTGSHNGAISKIAIQTRGITNSQEVLSMVPGLFIGQHAGGGKAEQMFLRGFDLDHGTDINISVDGMPVNMVSHAHGQGYSDLHFVIPELIESVQFNKGPYYPEKGDFTTAGYVALNTRNSITTNSVKIEGGMFDTRRAVAMINLLPDRYSVKGKSAFLAGEYMGTNGYFDHPQHFKRINLFGRYRQELNDRNTLNLSASFFTSNWDASGQIPERAVNDHSISFFGAIDPNEGGKTTRGNLNASLNTSLANNFYLKNQVYFSQYQFELYSNFTFFKIDSISGDQIRQKENRQLAGYNGSISKAGFIGNMKLNSEAGIGIRLDFTNGTELSRTKDRMIVTAPIENGDIFEASSSLYLKEELQIASRFTINAGARFDHFDFTYTDLLAGKSKRSFHGNIFSPKISLLYQTGEQTQVYLSMGKGFHSNDARVSVYKTTKDVLPAMYGADLGMIWKPVSTLFINAALWYSHLSQELIYVGDEGIVEPGGKTQRLGIDLSLRYQPVKWLYLDADGNYCHARATEAARGEDYLPLSPVFSSAGGALFKSPKGINAGLRYRFMGRRPANESNTVVADKYFVTDCMIEYARTRYEIRLSALNIFDVRWKETQFDTESRLKDEPQPVSEIHFTPGTPFMLKLGINYFFK